LPERKEKKVENTENLNTNDLDHVGSDELENVAGGNLKYVVCCTCGAQVSTDRPTGAYYNHNICPFCKGRLKSW
jgi:hypothetical protein